jgi:hypothetical protein
VAAAGGGGSGDMEKTVYDTTDNGMVDIAETLDGMTATVTEINHLVGVTAPVQSQLNTKITITEVMQMQGAMLARIAGHIMY